MRNPYAPGAGNKPPVIAGRDDLVTTATTALARARLGRHAKSFIAVGLRGVGKTVVLNRILDIAEDDKFHVVYIEAHENANLAQLIIPQLRKVLIKLSKSAQAGELAKQGLSILKNFANAFKATYNDIEFGISFPDTQGVADSGDLSNDLPELLNIVGQTAKSKNTAVVLLIDELQYLSHEEMGALVMAIHRMNQRGLPIVLVGAGLPQLLGKMGDSKSYAERLFDFPRVEALTEPYARIALSEPAESEGVQIEEEAFSALLDVTKGYPYFLQEWGYVAWNIASNDRITLSDVLNAGPEAIRRLDESFFRVRLERMTPTERKYISAMAKLGDGPHASGDIAKAYGAAVSTVAPLRSSLIAKGMIFSPSYGTTDFTVPLFASFIQREMPQSTPRI
ncbi:ATP-binding protein [Jiella sp. MQZ13P-4]|uniref:ATP-binding protein n=2 Tax=Jiella sonneratiae TaxID=2816856 RepID=A0ABS3J5L8_9HYPH|nr:ATP-binding protein [Jiella sonneratiae]MBO0904979.1 ATP-binding protein [Jiella sonneratiae]